MNRVFREVNTLLKPFQGNYRPDTPFPAPAMDECPFPTNMDTLTPMCDALSRYRTIDGSCNNLRYPLWGKSFRPMNRFLPAEYSDSK